MSVQDKGHSTTQHHTALHNTTITTQLYTPRATFIFVFLLVLLLLLLGETSMFKIPHFTLVEEQKVFKKQC